MTLKPRLALLYLLSALYLHDVHANKQLELDSLRQRISALQQEMEKTSDTKSETADALRESERAISNSNRTLYKLSKQQREANLTLGQYQQQTRHISQEMQGQQTAKSAQTAE